MTKIALNWNRLLDWLIDLFCGPDGADCYPAENGDGEPEEPFDGERWW